MRALIRLDLRPASTFVALWDKREEFEEAVVAVFRRAGFPPYEPQNGERSVPSAQGHSRSFGHDVLVGCPEVERVFRGAPSDIRLVESRRLIMMGYSPEGQDVFVVSAVNPTVLHVRFQMNVFRRLRRACAELSSALRSDRHQVLSGVSALERLRLLSFLRRVGLKQDDAVSSMCEVRSQIDVMEEERDEPTIIGTIVSPTAARLIKDNWGETFILLITFLLSAWLFFKGPTLANRIAPWLGQAEDYTRSAVERVYSAFFVTFCITLFTLAIRWVELLRFKPIRWNEGIEPNKR
jgi:hypothetical protein